MSHFRTTMWLLWFVIIFDISGPALLVRTVFSPMSAVYCLVRGELCSIRVVVVSIDIVVHAWEVGRRTTRGVGGAQCRVIFTAAIIFPNESPSFLTVLEVWSTRVEFGVPGD